MTDGSGVENAATPREAMAHFLDEGKAAVEAESDGLTVWITGVDGDLVGWDEHESTVNPFLMDYKEFSELTTGDFMIIDVAETPLYGVENVR